MPSKLLYHKKTSLIGAVNKQNTLILFEVLATVVRRPIVRVRFYSGFLYFSVNKFFWIISSILFRASNNQIEDNLKNNKNEFHFAAFRSEIKFHTISTQH